MNPLKFWYYKLTHSILCKFGRHRLILWNNNIEGGDMQCWCCEKVGGGWIRHSVQITGVEL